MRDRSVYTDCLLNAKDEDSLSLLVGMNNSGKTFILKLFSSRLELEFNVPAENIIYVNLDPLSGEKIRESLNLYYFLQKKLLIAGKKYIILDEIEYVDRWERAIRIILDTYDVKIYLSSSNLNLLENEIILNNEYKTTVTQIYPLSFIEFIYFGKKSFIDNLDDSFIDYINNGSLPRVIHISNNIDNVNFLKQSVYSSIVLNEILLKNKIGDYYILHSIIQVLADNIGQNLSPNKIASISAKKSNKYLAKINPASRTAESHIEMLKKSFLLHEVQRLDLEEEKVLKTLGKYYFNEIGMINFLATEKHAINQGLIENIVYLELKRKGYEVFNGKYKDRYITFVAKNNGLNLYIHVMENIDKIKELSKNLSILNDFSNHGESVLIYFGNRIETGIETGNVKIVYLFDFLI